MRKSALSVPYENLSAMQRHLGQADTADQMQKLAEDANASRQMGTAAKPKKKTTIRR